MKSNRGAGRASLSFESMRKLSVATTMLCLVPIACGRDRRVRDANSSSTAAVSQAVSVVSTPLATSSTTKSGCPRTGQWALCSVEKRLEQSGFVVIPAKEQGSHRPGFSVLPAVYTLGRSRLEVFLYPTAAAAAKDVEGLDTTTAAPKGTPNRWGMPPTFVRSVNLIAIFLTDSPVQSERLTLALTAGAPQP